MAATWAASLREHPPASWAARQPHTSSSVLCPGMLRIVLLLLSSTVP